jgi:hypothetical protein
MDILEICPPKNLVFSIPSDLQRVLTITNLTLRSLYVHVLRSHPYEVSVSREWALMSAFEELKIEVGLNFNQEMQNCALAKLRVYYYETDEEEDQQAMCKRVFSHDNRTQFEEITIQYDIHAPTLHYEQMQAHDRLRFEPTCPEAASRSYLMRRVHPPRTGGAVGGERLKNEIFTYLQQLSYVASIEECEDNLTFLIEFKQGQEDVCELVTFTLHDAEVVFALARIIAYGKPSAVPTLVSIDSDEELPALRPLEPPTSPPSR